MREGKTELRIDPTLNLYFRARYQCEHCGYTGYRSTVDGKASDEPHGHNRIRTRMYCAGDCDEPNRWHRLIDIRWTKEVPLPSGEPCLLDGTRFKAKE